MVDVAEQTRAVRGEMAHVARTGGVGPSLVCVLDRCQPGRPTSLAPGLARGMRPLRKRDPDTREKRGLVIRHPWRPMAGIRRPPPATRASGKDLPHRRVNGHVEVPGYGHEKSPPCRVAQSVLGGPPPRARA